MKPHEVEIEALRAQADWHQGRIGYIDETIAALQEQRQDHINRQAELYLQAAHLGAVALQIPEQHDPMRDF